MKVFKVIFIILLVIAAIILLLGFIGPKEYHVVRSIEIQAPQDLVFRHIKFWKNWQAWSPWAEMDSTMKIEIVGQDGAVGSKYVWMGDEKKTGQGEIVNTGLDENKQIDFHLHFIKPWESESDGYIRIDENNEKVMVSWAFFGENSFLFRIVGLFMNMEDMVGKDLDRGLVLLKGVCEQEFKQISLYQVQITTFPAKIYAGVQDTITMSEMSDFLQKSFGLLMQQTGEQGIAVQGAPAALYFSWDEQNQTTDVAAVVPVSVRFKPSEEIKLIRLPREQAFCIDYFGPYEKIGDAYYAMDYYLKDNNIKPGEFVVEEYLTDPQQEPDSSKWLTRIYFFEE